MPSLYLVSCHGATSISFIFEKEVEHLRYLMQKNDRVPFSDKRPPGTIRYEKKAKVFVWLFGFWSKHVLHLAMMLNPFIR